MAQTYVCDLCGQVAGDFMITVISDGTVVCVGIECLLDWALPLANSYAEVVAAHADPVEGPVTAVEGADADWEAGYPEGRPEGPGTGAEAVTEDVGSTAEAGQASHVDR